MYFLFEESYNIAHKSKSKSTYHLNGCLDALFPIKCIMSSVQMQSNILKILKYLVLILDDHNLWQVCAWWCQAWKLPAWSSGHAWWKKIISCWSWARYCTLLLFLYNFKYLSCDSIEHLIILYQFWMLATRWRESTTGLHVDYDQRPDVFRYKSTMSWFCKC